MYRYVCLQLVKSYVVFVHLYLIWMHVFVKSTELSIIILISMVLVTLCWQSPVHAIVSDVYSLTLSLHAASVKADFKDSRDHCSGNLKIVYRGQRYPVCKDYLKNSEVRNTICKDLQCGETGETLEFFGPLPQSKVVSGLTDRNITLQDEGHCPLGGLQCSGMSKICCSDSNLFMHCRDTVWDYCKYS